MKKALIVIALIVAVYVLAMAARKTERRVTLPARCDASSSYAWDEANQWCSYQTLTVEQMVAEGLMEEEQQPSVGVHNDPAYEGLLIEEAAEYYYDSLPVKQAADDLIDFMCDQATVGC